MTERILFVALGTLLWLLLASKRFVLPKFQHEFREHWAWKCVIGLLGSGLIFSGFYLGEPKPPPKDPADPETVVTRLVNQVTVINTFNLHTSNVVFIPQVQKHPSNPELIEVSFSLEHTANFPLGHYNLSEQATASGLSSAVRDFIRALRGHYRDESIQIDAEFEGLADGHPVGVLKYVGSRIPSTEVQGIGATREIVAGTALINKELAFVRAYTVYETCTALINQPTVRARIDEVTFRAAETQSKGQNYRTATVRLWIAATELRRAYAKLNSEIPAI